MIRISLGAAAIGFMLVGAFLIAAPAFGFSTMGADRGVDAWTGPDPEAYLGVVDNSDDRDADVAPRTDRRGEVFYLNDTVDAFDSSAVDATAVSFDGEPTDLQASVEPSDGEHDYVVAVSCGDSRTNADGRLELDFSADGRVGVELTRTTTEQIRVNCRGGGFESVSASDLFSAVGGEADQTFTFDPDERLGNRDRVAIDLSDPQDGALDYSEASVTAVSPSSAGRAEFVDDDRIEFTAQGSVNREVELTVEGVQIEAPFSSDEYEVAFERSDTGATMTDTFSSTRIFVVE